jgi:hypothetical protein
MFEAFLIVIGGPALVLAIGTVGVLVLLAYDKVRPPKDEA